jgi:hypothetical protein
MPPIPPSVIGTSSPILADWYTHSQLNVLFDAHGFPGDAPEGNKVEKCRVWLRRGNAELEDALTCFANLIAEMMDTEWEPPRQTVWDTSDVQPTPDPREKLSASLAKEGLTYARGGYIHGAHLRGPTKSLGDRLKLNGMQAVETEFDRAYKSVTFDPPAALTAACAILEAVCKNYIEDERLEMPSKQVLGSLWPTVAQHLGLSPKEVGDDDLKQILSGLYSVSSGVAALRTHEGSAHGRGSKKAYKLMPRHARLAVHAAHTMTMFILETWEARKDRTVR